jgi:hypothetical protein
MLYGNARISNVGKRRYLINNVSICYELKIETRGFHSSLFVLKGHVIQVTAAAIGQTC